MKDVIALARDHERLVATAKKVVADWQAHNVLAVQPTEPSDPPMQVIKWQSLQDLLALFLKKEASSC